MRLNPRVWNILMGVFYGPIIIIILINILSFETVERLRAIPGIISFTGFYAIFLLLFLGAYVEKGEYLEGDLVVTMDDGSKEIHKLIELDLPDISSPEDVDMTSAEEEIKMQVPDNLLFDFDESQVKSEATNTLDEIINDLEKLEEGTVIHINGHTDNQGNAEYNQGLSEQRAQSVYNYFTKNGDINHLNILAKGYGETKPIESNDNDEGRAKNRRVEVVINPKD